MKIVQKLLLANAVDINAQGSKGPTSLHLAAQNGCLEVVLELLQGGAIIDTKDNWGQTALDLAVIKSEASVVKLLIEWGANVSATSKVGSQPLHQAAQSGSVDVAKLLVDAGADVDKKNREGRTPLITALINGHLNVVKYLLTTDAKAKLQSDKDSLLQFLSILPSEFKAGALDFLSVQAVELFTQENKDSLLWHSAVLGNVGMVQRLLDLGADLRSISDESTDLLKFHLTNSHLQLVETLLERKAVTVKQKDKDEWSLLHYAARDSCPDVVTILLDRGSDINITTRSRMTALHLAAIAGDKISVDILLKAGARKNEADRRGWTPLHVSSAYSETAITTSLLLDGADVNLPDSRGHTPLHVAASRGNEKIVELLLAQHPLITIDDNGWSPAVMADRRGFCDLSLRLLSVGSDGEIANPLEFRSPRMWCSVDKAEFLEMSQDGCEATLRGKSYISIPHGFSTSYTEI